MKLIRLSANKPSFKTVSFLGSGISLIVAEKAEPDEKGGRRTFNGVGKSLIGYFVNYCLGSAYNVKLKTLLPEWIFTLHFEHDGMIYKVDRSTATGAEIFLNEVPLTVDNFNKTLGGLCFSLTGTENYLSFRTLIKRFLRCGKRSYMSFDQFESNEEDFQQLIANGHLYGLPSDLIYRKYILRKEQLETNDLHKRLQSDEVFRKFFSANSDAKIQRKDLEDKTARLERELAEFKIADNYSDIKIDVAEAKRSLRDCVNELSSISTRISKIDQNLELGADLSGDHLVELLEAANIALRDGVRKNLQELQAFHEGMLRDRHKRLESERAKMLSKQEELLRIKKSLDSKLARNLAFLDAHGELSEYMVLSRKLSALRSELQKILDYQELLSRYKEKLTQIKSEQALQSIESNDFLKTHAELLEQNLEIFRSFSSRFYEDKPGGVTVASNDGTNQLRFKIECKIEDDSASGINQVKIFCFDLMILALKRNHQVQFLFHDSQLFSNMDSRQRSIAFQIAHEFANANGLQYIASLNQDAVDSIRAEMTPEAFGETIEKARVLTLTDKSDGEKLLGVHIDFDYDS